jgi:cytochrome c556
MHFSGYRPFFLRALGSKTLMIGSNAIWVLLMLAVEPALAATQSTATASAADAPIMADDPIEDRRPLPLLQMMADHQKQMMRDHLAAVQEIVTALAANDFGAAERAAVRLGFSDEVGRICVRIGAASPAFASQALAFHHTADGIAAAARLRDRSRVLAQLSTTLQACRACHAQWKQQVVDEPTWDRLTAAPRSAVPTHE